MGNSFLVLIPRIMGEVVLGGVKAESFNADLTVDDWTKKRGLGKWSPTSSHDRGSAAGIRNLGGKPTSWNLEGREKSQRAWHTIFNFISPSASRAVLGFSFGFGFVSESTGKKDGRELSRFS